MLQKVSVFTKREKITYIFLLSEGFLMVTLFFIWWFNPNHISNNFSGIKHFLDYVLFILLSYVIWYELVNQIFIWYVSGFSSHPVPMLPNPNLRVAFLTAFVPSSEPIEVLEKTLKSMIYCDCPHDVWILDEGNSDEVKRLCEKYGARHYSRRGIEKYNTEIGKYKVKTKGGNYNSWFDQYGNNYDIVAQLDVDFSPHKDFLSKTLGYFNDPKVAFVGTPQIYGNLSDGFIVRGAAEQAYSFYGAMQKGLFGEDMTLLIGSNHLVRVSAHDDIEGYSGHIVEDHLTGMKFYAKKWKSVYVPEILAIGEGPSTWGGYFSQQMRWAYGLFDILFRHSFKIFKSMDFKHRIYYFLLQQYYFYGIAQIIALILLSVFFLFGLQITPMNLFELLIYFVPILLFEQLFFLFLQRANIDPKTEKGLMLNAKILNLAAWPIYLIAFIMSVTKRKLVYKVTPKGKNQLNQTDLSIFIPHFILGSLSLICILSVPFLSHFSPLLFFWAVFNTLVMYGFIAFEIFKKLKNLPRKNVEMFISAPAALLIGFELSYNILRFLVR